MRQIETGADADLEHATARHREHALSIGLKMAFAHVQVDDVRQDPFVVEAHEAAHFPASRATLDFVRLNVPCFDSSGRVRSHSPSPVRFLR